MKNAKKNKYSLRGASIQVFEINKQPREGGGAGIVIHVAGLERKNLCRGLSYWWQRAFNIVVKVMIHT